MAQTNDLHTSQLAGSQREGTPPATVAHSAGLAIFLARLTSPALSETGRRNVCRRFHLNDDELTAALASCDWPAKRRALLPIPAKEFGADTLADAMMLTGTTCPTPAQLDTALLQMYPVGGPTAANLVAAGWLLPTIDKKGLRLPVEASPYSSQRNGNC